MLNSFRSFARPRLTAGAAVCVLAGLLVAAGPAPVQAASAHDLVGSWVTRLDQRAAEIEAAPRVKATRIGAGQVLKKGDGGMVDAIVPGPVEPTGQAAIQPAAIQPVAAVVPAPVPTTIPVPAQASVAAIATPALAQPAAPLPDASALPADAPVAVVEPPLPPPPALVMRVRARSADRVGRLATRLIELGFLPREQWSDSFDDNIETAVRAFQLGEGLMPDGKVGEVTRQALDRTPAEAVSLIRGATAALRAFQATVPDTVILVNLPSQTVSYVEHGKLMFTMRAVVGRPTRKTPLLQDRVTSVTINPTWTVPPTVLNEDKLPNLRKKGNSGIKDAIVYLDGQEVAPERVNWWSVTANRIKIVQRPGDDNALGRFRFNLTNGDGIFLHGTNDPKLFDRDMRAASSGCVRLADARMVAETLLRPAKVVTADIDHQLESGKTKTIALPSAIPVRFVYWTATVAPEGGVRLHPGIYEDVPTGPTATPVPSVPPAALAPKRLEPKQDRLPAPNAQSGAPQSADTRDRARVVRAAM